MLIIIVDSRLLFWACRALCCIALLSETSPSTVDSAISIMLLSMVELNSAQSSCAGCVTVGVDAGSEHALIAVVRMAIIGKRHFLVRQMNNLFSIIFLVSLNIKMVWLLEKKRTGCGSSDSSMQSD